METLSLKERYYNLPRPVRYGLLPAIYAAIIALLEGIPFLIPSLLDDSGFITPIFTIPFLVLLLPVSGGHVLTTILSTIIVEALFPSTLIQFLILAIVAFGLNYVIGYIVGRVTKRFGIAIVFWIVIQILLVVVLS